MLKTYELTDNYSDEEIMAIEEALLENDYTEEEAINLIESGEFYLHDNCHTLKEVINFRKETFGGSCYKTPFEIEANEIWFDTKVGIIILN